MWQVQMQFIPKSDQIWVARLAEGDQIYEYPEQLDAAAKAIELQATDPTGRKYRIIEL